MFCVISVVFHQKPPHFILMYRSCFEQNAVCGILTSLTNRVISVKIALRMKKGGLDNQQPGHEQEHRPLAY